MTRKNWLGLSLSLIILTSSCATQAGLWHESLINLATGEALEHHLDMRHFGIFSSPVRGNVTLIVWCASHNELQFIELPLNTMIDHRPVMRPRQKREPEPLDSIQPRENVRYE